MSAGAAQKTAAANYSALMEEIENVTRAKTTLEK